MEEHEVSLFLCASFFSGERSHSFHQIIKGSVSPPKRLGIAAVDDWDFRKCSDCSMSDCIIPSSFRHSGPARMWEFPMLGLRWCKVNNSLELFKKQFLQRKSIKIDTWGDLEFTPMWCASVYFFLITSSHYLLPQSASSPWHLGSNPGGHHDRFPPEKSRHVERFQLKRRTCLQPQHKVHTTTTVNHTTQRAGVTQSPQLPRDTYQAGHPESSEITSQETREKASPQLG